MCFAGPRFFRVGFDFLRRFIDSQTANKIVILDSKLITFDVEYNSINELFKLLRQVSRSLLAYHCHYQNHISSQCSLSLEALRREAFITKTVTES